MRTSILKNRKVRRLGGMFLMALAGSLLALMAYSRIVHPNVVISAEEPQFAHFTKLDTNAIGDNLDFTYAAEKTVQVVVHVKTLTVENGPAENPFYEFFFGDNDYNQRPQRIAGFGSGVIISSDGYIVTNNHVIDGAQKVQVTLNDKRTFTAKIIGRDPDTDLAVIKIDAKNLPFITYGNSDAIKVGQWVLAVGNPYNLTSTVTAGIISAKARNLNLLSSSDHSHNNYAIESFIQTDAAVNPGNSGGALVNTRGELIGINTAIESPTGSYIGNSFAIPSTIVAKVVSDIIHYGRVQRAFLGVSIRDIDQEFAQEKHLKELEGVYIAGVSQDGAAKNAGIKEGDVILSVNKVPVNSTAELQEEITRYHPDDKISVVVMRDNKKKQFEVTLRNMEGNTKIITAKDENIAVLGAQFGEVSSSEKSKLGIKSGVKVVSLTDGKLKNEGVQKGFIITKINNHPVYDADDLRNQLAGFKGGVLVEGVYPNGVVAYYAFGL